ncbi:hypothetical protein PSTG_00072 [Puccinia striiformis f. sp. tritici PST-78]|uniref:HAT C-terminal dimerisation domain-containing protein n=1 Tax=Puccinia striiformis f. sp. tritici PST-78 TaxID=1165861 RepID=A0A0L0W5J9_9BASI|nr:hypothetical protein PSTG_00072 [Puccinia striiformis f. sp. tritici PST-78]
MAQTPWVSASPRPSSPSRPPSRKSSWIKTPVKSHLNYVRTNNDTRQSLVNSSQVQKPVKKQKILVVADTDDSYHSSDDPEEIPERHSAAQSEANLDVKILDLAQNSDEENQKSNKSKKQPTQGAAVTGFDKLELYLYYEPPRQAEGVKGKDTRHNLNLHRDGSLTQAACPRRYAAIKAGANLPVTLKEEAAPKTKKQSESGITLNSRTWAAAEAHRLCANSKDKVLNNLQALKSKITLIHDVWTTKGNRQAFLGIIATYISDDWVFKICHLALKYIAWTHKGKYLTVPMASIIMKSLIASKITQTTDSGSNNRTMTVEVDRLVSEKIGVDLNFTNNHIRCFCHKIALILTTGLKAIDISTEVLAPEKQETLGFIPKLNTIIEEPEEEEEDILEDGPDDSEGKSDPEEPDGSHGTQGSQNRTQERSQVLMVLKKVNFVIHRITSSAVRQSEFAVWAKKLEHVGQSLIAGYGIRWNIKWESQNRAYQASEVVHKLIYNKTLRHKRKGGKHYFQEYEISTTDWEIVKSLHDILGEFYFTTKKMEGDHSSASLMLSEYQCIKNFLEKQIAAAPEPKLKAMMVRMIKKTNTYLDEALSCNAIIQATILKPAYRLSIFEVLFTAHHTYAKALLQRHFNERKLEIEARTGTRASSPLAEVASKPTTNCRGGELFNFYPDSRAAPPEEELATYIGWKHKLDTDNAEEYLKWWGDHHQEFPILASMAKDYLACSATSAGVERCFSAAADSGCKWVGSTRERPETRRVPGRVRAASDPNKPEPTRPGKTRPLIGFGFGQPVSLSDRPANPTVTQLWGHAQHPKGAGAPNLERFCPNPTRPRALGVPQLKCGGYRVDPGRPGPDPNPTQPKPLVTGFGFGQPFLISDPTQPNPACTLGRWLRQGVQVNGDFDMAQAIITQATKEYKEAKATI